MVGSSDASGIPPRPVKRSVSLAIRSPDVESLLLVRRPEDDAELPGAWGLPAASLGSAESWEEAVVRAGREKLGVTVEPGPVLNHGVQEREAYRLEMRLYAAQIVAGEPRVPQPHAGVTRYSAWRWGSTEEMRPAAGRGSLCARLLLECAESGDLRSGSS